MGSRSRGLYRKLGSAADLLPTLTNACACAGTYLHVHVRVRVRVRARARVRVRVRVRMRVRVPVRVWHAYRGRMPGHPLLGPRRLPGSQRPPVKSMRV